MRSFRGLMVKSLFKTAMKPEGLTDEELKILEDVMSGYGALGWSRFSELVGKDGGSAEVIDLTNGKEGLSKIYAFDWRGDKHVADMDGENISGSEAANHWIYNISPEDYVDDEDHQEDYFSGIAYHATPGENVKSILREGLSPMNKTRGLSNRWIGSAIFASFNPEAIDSYGDYIFEIDLSAMRKDYEQKNEELPVIEMEPALYREKMINSIAWALGVEYSDSEAANDGVDHDTIIINGHIPSEYISLNEQWSEFDPNEWPDESDYAIDRLSKWLRNNGFKKEAKDTAMLGAHKVRAGMVAKLHKAAAQADKEYLKKINIKSLQKQIAKSPEQDPRSYFESLSEKAEDGPIFNRSILNGIALIGDDLLPNKNRKLFIKWLANINMSGETIANNDLIQIKDYANSLDVFPEPGMGPWQSISAQTMIQAAVKWHEQFVPAIEVGEYNTKNVHHDFGDGYTIVLVPPEDAEIEGSNMGHCVGDYCDKISRGSIKIYSLRDAKNEPHVTIEVGGPSGRDVHQIRGKENAPPIQKYAPYIRNWLDEYFAPIDYENSDDYWMIAETEKIMDNYYSGALWSPDEVIAVLTGREEHNLVDGVLSNMKEKGKEFNLSSVFFSILGMSALSPIALRFLMENVETIIIDERSYAFEKVMSANKDNHLPDGLISKAVSSYVLHSEHISETEVLSIFDSLETEELREALIETSLDSHLEWRALVILPVEKYKTIEFIRERMKVWVDAFNSNMEVKNFGIPDGYMIQDMMKNLPNEVFDDEELKKSARVFLDRYVIYNMENQNDYYKKEQAIEALGEYATNVNLKELLTNNTMHTLDAALAENNSDSFDEFTGNGLHTAEEFITIAMRMAKRYVCSDYKKYLKLLNGRFNDPRFEVLNKKFAKCMVESHPDSYFELEIHKKGPSDIYAAAATPAAKALSEKDPDEFFKLNLHMVAEYSEFGLAVAESMATGEHPWTFFEATLGGTADERYDNLAEVAIDRTIESFPWIFFGGNLYKIDKYKDRIPIAMKKMVELGPRTFFDLKFHESDEYGHLAMEAAESLAKTSPYEFFDSKIHEIYGDADFAISAASRLARVKGGHYFFELGLDKIDDYKDLTPNRRIAGRRAI
jgi:hypothetical protein